MLMTLFGTECVPNVCLQRRVRLRAHSQCEERQPVDPGAFKQPQRLAGCMAQ